MSLIWMDGFDSYGPLKNPSGGQNDPVLSQLLLSSGYVFANGVGIGSDTRTGYGRSLWLSWDSFGTPSDMRLAFVPKDEIITGFAFKYEPTALARIMEFLWDDRLGTITTQLRLYVNGEGGISMSIDNGASLRAASPPNLVFPNVWQYIEVRYRPDKTSGQIIIKVDGQTCVQIDGPTSPMTTPNQVNMLKLITTAGEWNIGLSSTTNGVKKFDDWYVLDALGTGFNDFLGDVVVHSVNVVSDQGPNDLSQFGGTIGHFTSLNQIPTDEDQSYLYGNASGAKEMFGLDALPDNIIDVLAMSVHVRGRKDAPGVAMIHPVMKYDTHEVTGASVPLAVQYVTKSLFMEQCPDGTAWTKAKAEATIIGFEVD